MGHFYLKIIVEDKVVRLIKDNCIKMMCRQDCRFYQMSLKTTKHNILVYVTWRSGLCKLQMLFANFFLKL